MILRRARMQNDKFQFHCNFLCDPLKATTEPKKANLIFNNLKNTIQCIHQEEIL